MSLAKTVIIIATGPDRFVPCNLNLSEILMNGIFLDRIPFHADRQELARLLHVRPGSPDEGDFLAFVDELEAVARPKVIYRIAFIEERGEAAILIDGVRFQSRILCVNLADVHRVFPYLATCGEELAARREREEDILRQFWADALMEAALHSAMDAMLVDLSFRFQSARVSAMNPGSLADWPITQQSPFFQLLGEEAHLTGVRLTDSMLMIPAKSTTGLFFETESGYVNCQLCPRQTCPNRRAGYNPMLENEKYRKPTDST